MGERHKLTKTYLMSLPEGSYMVSNLFLNPMRSSFAEEVAPLNMRIHQWDRIIAADVQQKLCIVFESEAEFQKWLGELNYHIDKGEKHPIH